MCGKQFHAWKGLNHHVKEVHEGVKEHNYDICGKSFASKATCDDHRRIHTGERPYVCDECGKTFKTKASLCIHKKNHLYLFSFFMPLLSQTVQKERWFASSYDFMYRRATICIGSVSESSEL